jgi:hypothetical protein
MFMKPSLLTETDLNYILARIDKLNPDSKRQWGKMNVNQMMRHVNDFLNFTTGLKKAKDRSNFLMSSFGKWFALSFPFIKNLPTAPEANEVRNNIFPEDFEMERNNLKKFIRDFSTHSGEFENHVIFGKMTREEYGILFYKHLDHHLSQFGA